MTSAGAPGGRARRAAAAVIVAVLGLGACAHTYHREHVVAGLRLERTGLVAVIPFENLTTYPNAGEIVSHLVATELYARGFALLEEHEVRRSLRLQPDDEGRALAAIELAAIGRELGVDAVLGGSVGEFRYKRDLGEDPVVGFTVRLVEVATGEVLWTASHSRAEHGLLYHEHHLHENAQRVAEEMVDRFVDACEGTPPVRAPRRARPSPRPDSLALPQEGDAPSPRAVFRRPAGAPRPGLVGGLAGGTGAVDSGARGSRETATGTTVTPPDLGAARDGSRGEAAPPAFPPGAPDAGASAATVGTATPAKRREP